MLQHLRNHCRTFYHAGVWCDISLQYSDTTSPGIWIVHGADHLWIFIDTVLDVLAYCLASNRHAIQVQKSQLADFLHNGVDTACLI